MDFLGMESTAPLQALTGIVRPLQINQARSLAEQPAPYLATSTYTRKGAIAVSHRARTGAKMSDTLDIYYNRIHVFPPRFDLGNVVSTQRREVLVWNAYFEPRTLLTVKVNNPTGVVLTGPAAPYVFLPLQEKIWEARIEADGPADIDTSIVWEFLGDPDVVARLTGSRITFWSFAPTWDGGILERLEWLTDILASPKGVEQRRSLRLSPRRSFQLKLIATEEERMYMDLSVFAEGARRWAIPIWPDVQQVETVQADQVYIPCSTRGRDFREGGLVVFKGRDAFAYKLGEIAELTPDGITLREPLGAVWPSGTRMYPVRSAMLTEQPQATRLTDWNSTITASFLLTEHSDWDVLPPEEMYLGSPAFLVRPEESESLTNTYQRLLATIDNKTSYPTQKDTAGLGFIAMSHRWLLHNREMQRKMRGLFYYMAGRWKTVWMPTHFNDLQITARLEATADNLDVKYVGYTKFGKGKPGKQDILFVLRTGQQIMRRITGSTDLENGVERLSLSSPLGVDVQPSDVLRISFMALCRLDQDFIEINHQTDSDGVAAVRTVWRSIRDDLGN